MISLLIKISVANGEVGMGERLRRQMEFWTINKGFHLR